MILELRNQIKPGDELRMQHSRHNMYQGSVEEYLAAIPDEYRDQWPKPFHLSSGSTEEILKRGAERFRWVERWNGWGKPSSIDGPRHRAVGVGTGAHVCGVEFEGNASAMVRLNPDGSLKVHCSVGRQGQGSETTQAQVAAEEMGLPLSMVEVETGDTDSCPWSHGSIASNTMFRVGWATREATRDARRQLLEIAARDIFDHVKITDLDITDGYVHKIGNPFY